MKETVYYAKKTVFKTTTREKINIMRLTVTGYVLLDACVSNLLILYN